MPTDFLTLAQGGLGTKKKKQCWLPYKHRVYVHFYGPRYIACQCAKSVLGQSPGTLLPPFFPNTMKGIGLHPGQDSQPGLPSHQSAPPGPQRDSGEALAGQHSWTQAAKQSLSSRACLGESREGNGACGKEQGGHGYIWVQGRSLPCCSLSHCCCSFDPLRWTETLSASAAVSLSSHHLERTHCSPAILYTLQDGAFDAHLHIGGSRNEYHLPGMVKRRGGGGGKAALPESSTFQNP